MLRVCLVREILFVSHWSCLCRFCANALMCEEKGEDGCHGNRLNQWRIEEDIIEVKFKTKTSMASSGETVREQFSALQKQQKDRLQQLQEKSTKKKVPTADVGAEELNKHQINFLFFLYLGQCVDEFGSGFWSISTRRGSLFS